MKQKLLLMVLALGMCSTMVLSQTTRECVVEDDGFEWYKTKGTNGDQEVYGAEDRNGNILLPCVFGEIRYDYYDERSWGAYGAGFIVRKPFKPRRSISERDCVGYYLRNGKCIIPFARTMVVERKRTESLMGTYYECVKLADRETDFRKVICDVNGKETIVFNNIDYQNVDHLQFRQEKGVFYIQFTAYHLESGYGHGLADGNGKIIVAPKSGQPEIVLSKNGQNFGFTDSTGKWISLAPVTSMSTKVNPLANNPKENPDATLLVSTQQPNNISSSRTSSTRNNSSNSNSGKSTQTVVVEHHRDPVPVQEWQQCPGCYGSGQCPMVQCGGSGWYYVGDRVTTCSRCHGSGKCTTCAGKGGHYITVYR